jgi:predicted nucleic acid-binding protein
MTNNSIQRIAISDTSPIISLAAIDKLWLLDHLFKEYFIPTAVWEELFYGEKGEHKMAIVTQ